MKILLASVPFEGHLPPVAALGQALHKQGHQVQLWTAPKALQTLERLAPGAQHVGGKLAPIACRVSFPDLLLQRTELFVLSPALTCRL
jgi:UDP:flavonoid glycosyltransferase YjiC (YdhE family)